MINNKLIIFISILLLLISLNLYAANVQQYTDDKGVTHFRFNGGNDSDTKSVVNQNATEDSIYVMKALYEKLGVSEGDYLWFKRHYYHNRNYFAGLTKVRINDMSLEGKSLAITFEENGEETTEYFICDIYCDTDFEDRIVIGVKDLFYLSETELPKWDNKVLDAIKHWKIFVGMTKAQVITSIGRPKDINKTVTALGVHEQWVYTQGKGRYLYFDDDILTSYQD